MATVFYRQSRFAIPTRFSTAVLAFMVGMVSVSNAQTLQFGAAGTGGSGSWDTSTADWFNGSSVPWTNGDTASFGGTAGTATLNANLNAAGLTFGITGYIITGTGTLTLNGTPSIGSTATGGSTTTINQTVSASGPITLNSATGNTSTTFNFGSPSLSNTTPTQSTSTNSFAGGFSVVGTNIRLNFNSPGAGGTGAGAGTINVVSAASRITNAGSLPAFNNTIANNIVLNSGNASGSFVTALGATTPSGTVTSYATTTVFNYTGVISGSSDVIIANSTTSTGGGAGVTVFSNNMTYTGNTVLNGSTTTVFRLGTNSALPSTSQLQFGLSGQTGNVGIFDMNGYNLTVSSLLTNTTFATSAANGPGITNSSDATNGGGAGVKTITLAGSGSTTIAATFSNIIGTLNNTTWFTGAGAPANPGGTNNIAVTINNSNLTQTFSGANTYTGGTTITAGTLQIGAKNAVPSGGLTLNGGTFGNSPGTSANPATTVAGFTDTPGNLTVSANSAITLGTGYQTLNFTGLNVTGSPSLTITGWNGVPGTPSTSGTGTLLFTGTNFTSVAAADTAYSSFLQTVTFSPYSPGAQFIYNSTASAYELQPVPEPSTLLAISGVAFGAIGFFRRRLAVARDM